MSAFPSIRLSYVSSLEGGKVQTLVLAAKNHLFLLPLSPLYCYKILGRGAGDVLKCGSLLFFLFLNSSCLHLGFKPPLTPT